jgi:hypothetical protein
VTWRETFPRSGGPRHGISLLEVILATAILLGCVMVLSRLAFLARRHAIGSEDRTQSQLLCQNLMDELLAGIRPLESVSPTETEDGQWVYEIDLQRRGNPLLVAITVTVARLEEDELLPIDEELVGYRLVRWLRPGQRQVSADAEALMEPESDSDFFGDAEDAMLRDAWEPDAEEPDTQAWP